MYVAREVVEHELVSRVPVECATRPLVELVAGVHFYSSVHESKPTGINFQKCILEESTSAGCVCAVAAVVATGIRGRRMLKCEGGMFSKSSWSSRTASNSCLFGSNVLVNIAELMREVAEVLESIEDMTVQINKDRNFEV